MRRRRPGPELGPEDINLVDRFLAGGEVVQGWVGGRLAGAVLLFAPLGAVTGAAALVAGPFVAGPSVLGSALALVIGVAGTTGLVRLGDRLIAEELRQGGDD